MTGGAADAITIPARPTAKDLAGAIDRDVAEVMAALSARHAADSPEELLESGLAIAVAQSLGITVVIETRDLALEALYEFETRGEMSIDLDGRAERLVAGVIGEREDLDHDIESASEHWTVARMPLIDRNILRLGLYELRHESETPSAVIISEGVRLAQTYSTERSAPFVNGVLAALAATTRS